jgi:hypothetical protein
MIICKGCREPVEFITVNYPAAFELCFTCLAKAAELFINTIEAKTLSYNKKFTLHWLNGKTEEIKGPTIAIAFALAGYSGGALHALDYYEEH